jgi:protein involved in polysaccharide export with SLBB domain
MRVLLIPRERSLSHMRVPMYFISTASLSLFTLLFATSSLAQTATTGAIVGRVNDMDGRGVPNVTFTVTSVSLIRPQSATSGKKGNVLIPNLPPGKYTVSANVGISTSEQRVVEVNISRTSSVLILLRTRPENNSTAGIDQHRLSLKPILQEGSSLSRISVNSSKEYGKPTPRLDEQAIKIDPKNGAATAKLREAYARLPAEGKLSAENKAASAATEKPSVSSLPNSGDLAPRPAANAAELVQVYRVGIGDVLDIRLRRAPTDQSTLFTVTSHGMLEHPILARPFKVVGLTTDEISGRIGAVLKSRAVDENPEVLVGVREYVSHAILVSGLVMNPGTKVLRREAIPLYVVLADAQTVPEAGRAVIIAKETGEVIIVELADAKAMNVLVRPGDVINVQANPQWFFYIGGEVRTPGEKSFHRGITLTQAILIAGGLTRKSNEIQLAREGVNKLLELRRYKLNEINSGKLPDPLIQPGDRITVAH